jgi:hypothetical protein
MQQATPIVNRVESGIWGGLPIYGVRAPLTHATTGVVMKPKPKGAVEFVVVVVVLLVVVDW